MKKPLFKQYNPGEILLFPSRLDENINETHLVRIISQTVDKLDLTFLLSTYLGGGTTAYHPRMLLKVLLYAYCLKIYTGRRVANALRSDITFMWLSGNQFPDFRAINKFRSGHLKDSINTVFKSLLFLMFEEGYIHLDEYYCDGTTIQADANKHKVIWKKNASRFRESIEERIDFTLSEIDKLNEEEDAKYGDNDLEICGKQDPSRRDHIQESVDKLNIIINKGKDTNPSRVRKASHLQEELEKTPYARKPMRSKSEFAVTVAVTAKLIRLLVLCAPKSAKKIFDRHITE